MLYLSNTEKDGKIMTGEELRDHIHRFLDSLPEKRRVLAIPPDFTRFHSKAGVITEMIYTYYGSALTDVLPALGTHAPMTEGEISRMFGSVPSDRFRVHNWRKDITRLGTVPADIVREFTEGAVDFDWPAEVNTVLTEGGHDLILSVGQVVPHEVIGMANYNKNIFVGTGGSECINKSHFISAVHGIERILGTADNPVRKLLNYASEHYAAKMPIIYILTVVGYDSRGTLGVRGLFIGDDHDCFYRAAELSARENITLLEKPLEKVVVYLDPEEFKSTWLGNKSIYRTRMAIADGGELIVLAPGVKEFGEDKDNDVLIRKYGYPGTDRVMKLVEEDPELKENLGVAAHLIQGSSEGRFTITYCPGRLSREEIEHAHFRYGELESMLDRYDPEKLTNGFNTLSDGEEIYFISNPALGLWAERSKIGCI
jgi:nickel-dependent lactate racemase